MKFIIYLMYIPIKSLHSFLCKIFIIKNLGKTRQFFPGWMDLPDKEDEISW